MQTHLLTAQTQPHLCPLPSEECTVTLEISGSCSLRELAELVIASFGFDFDHAFGFYDNFQDTVHSTEKYTIFSDMGESEDGEPGVLETRVQEVFPPATQMILLFDYGDDWHFLLSRTATKPATTKRKVAKRTSIQGTPPLQYPNPDTDA